MEVIYECNLDLFKKDNFLEVSDIIPTKGDYIYTRDNRNYLEVVARRFKTQIGRHGIELPILIIELGIPRYYNMTISEFTKLWNREC